MPVVWVLVIVAVVVGLILTVRVGVRVSTRLKQIFVTVRAGPLRIRILPRKEKPERKRKKEKKPETPSEPSPEPSFPSREQILLAIATLPGPGARMIRAILRGIRVKPLTVRVEIGGNEDPAAAADLSGQAFALVWAVMPPLEHLLSIPDPSITIRPDFDAAENVVEYDIGVTARIGTLLIAALPLIRAALVILRTPAENPDDSGKNP